MTLAELEAKIARAKSIKQHTVVMRIADAESLAEQIRAASRPRRWWWPF